MSVKIMRYNAMKRASLIVFIIAMLFALVG